MAPNSTKKDGSLLVIGTHDEDNLEKALMTFMVASAATSVGVTVTIFLMSKATNLVRKGHAKNMPKMVGMEPMEDLISTFMEMGGKIMSASHAKRCEA